MLEILHGLWDWPFCDDFHLIVIHGYPPLADTVPQEGDGWHVEFTLVTFNKS